jgi:hypothetical protein
MTMGRPNKALGHVDGLDAGELEKARLKAILATITGELSVQEACEQLGIRRARFAELRHKALLGACTSLAPGRPGRPRQYDAEDNLRVTELEAEVDELGRELRTAAVRTELALAMPDIIAEYEKRGAAAKQRASKGKPK